MQLTLIIIQLLVLQQNLYSIECSASIALTSPAASSIRGSPLGGTQADRLSRVASQFQAPFRPALGSLILASHRDVDSPHADLQMRADPSHKSEALESTNNDGPPPPSLLRKMSSAVRNAIAPAKSYVELVNRYHRWYRTYNALKNKSDVPMKEASDVLRSEYAKVDERLASSSACNRAKGDSEEQLELESVDFVLTVLREVIGVLESKLEVLEKSSGHEEDLNSKPDETSADPEDDERVTRALERAKRTAVKTAMNVAKGELVTVAKIAAFNALATYVDAQQQAGAGGNALTLLAPVVHMLGSSSTSIVVSYLTNVEYRAALAVINRVNPIAIFNCGRFGK